ncbi:TetR/AcrR family transcriptional regulator [Nocardia brasiliensis]|uniref:TetR/AcrR family transcriptional regulator n=1 Tax=Nocardia brasiliensis TaxID=37326 RepID=UPI001893817A|nr:TetR/AcrR family transcriptional regulator [Nocardia brasiliensis]MBF6124095.1 TetR/AcrR family transcriptional regulator [Nocardia brasiliensis]
MSPQTRKERERAERHQRIIDTARELAETQGWEAVTVRKLAERIEYSQPVLYSHFAGKSAIVAAVAEQGIIDLTGEMRRAHAAAAGPADAMARVARAYLDFAAAHPARYDAMFSMHIDLVFGLDAPQPLKDAFAELEAMFRPFVGEAELGARTEVAWSAIHGLATLDRGHRLRPELRDQRLEILVAEWLSAVGADSA